LINPIVVERDLNVGPEEAFKCFVQGFGTWWPRAYTWSQDVLEVIGIEARTGGFCFEQGPNGFTVHWGTVTTCAPPHVLAFRWQISAKREPVPNPEMASEVLVEFLASSAASTRMRVEHAHFERHGEGAQQYRDMMASEYGWPYIADCFAKALPHD